MKTLFWMLALVSLSTLVAVLWLKWANAPLDRLMTAPRSSAEVQRRFIAETFPHRLTKLAPSDQDDNIYTPWAIKEAKRRSLFLAALWFISVTVSAAIAFRK